LRKIYIAYDLDDKELPVAIGTSKELKDFFKLASVDSIYSVVSKKLTIKKRFIIKVTNMVC